MKKLIFFSVVLSVLFASCEKEALEPLVMDESNVNVEILIPSTAKLITEKSIISYAEGEVLDAANYAQLLANAVADKSVRNFIKEESNKKFDGDYNFLVNKSMDAKVGTSTFKEKISQLNANTVLKSTSIFEAALQNEKLHVSVPVLIDEWDVNKHELLVAVAVDVVEGETEYVYAYDSKGRAYMLDANVEPDVPVIVIANNERLGMNSESDATEKAARVSGQNEHVGYLKCYDLSKIESWLKGGPEFRIDCVIYNGSSTMNAGESHVHCSRNSAKDGYDPNQDLFQWFFATDHGPNYYFKIWEIDDTGVTHSFPVKIGVPDIGDVGYSLTYKANDKGMIGRNINYKSAKPQYFEDSLIKIKLE